MLLLDRTLVENAAMYLLTGRLLYYATWFSIHVVLLHVQYRRLAMYVQPWMFLEN
jgi:hypothetical protein